MKLKVLHNGNDYSLKLNKLSAPLKEFDLSLNPLVIGFHKPLKNIYVELDSRIGEYQLDVKYFNGTSFVGFPEIEDNTEGFTKSGMISFPEDVDQYETDFEESGVPKYWIKISCDDLVSIAGINLVLSNDSDFGFVPNILQFLPEDMPSWISFHEEARDIIVQTIRNSGKRIIDSNLNSREVDVFDLLSINEFKNASKYMALHLIFDFLSKSDDDAYSIKSKRFLERYEQSLNSNLMTVDQNDNGKTDTDENLAVQFIGIRRG